MAGRESRRPRLIITAAAGLPDLDAAAVWILGALRRLLRHGSGRGAWGWVDLFDDLRECVRIIQEAKERPANLCPVVPTRMPFDVDAWPEPGQAIPVEFENRDVSAIDNRRLVGRVAKLLTDHISGPCTFAGRYRQQAQQTRDADDAEKADGYVLEARDRARRALRGVDLEGLSSAVTAEVQARAASDGPQPVADKGGKAELQVQFPSKKEAVVIEGRTTIKLRGSRQVWVFRSVVEAAPKSVSWIDLVSVDQGAVGEELLRRHRDYQARRSRNDDVNEGDLDDLEDAGGGLDAPATPKMALRPDSIQRTGNRIKKALGRLGYHWNQDGLGAWWSAEIA